MKKTKKTALTAALFAAAMTMTGCPADDSPQAVYGPPPTEEMTAAPETTAAATDAPTEAPARPYRPEEDVPQEVYGPPVEDNEAESGEDSQESSPDESAQEPTFDPKHGTPVTVYGPPQIEDSADDSYAPKHDTPAPDYGPPQ